MRLTKVIAWHYFNARRVSAGKWCLWLVINTLFEFFRCLNKSIKWFEVFFSESALKSSIIIEFGSCDINCYVTTIGLSFLFVQTRHEKRELERETFEYRAKKGWVHYKKILEIHRVWYRSEMFFSTHNFCRCALGGFSTWKTAPLNCPGITETICGGIWITIFISCVQTLMIRENLTNHNLWLRHCSTCATATY